MRVQHTVYPTDPSSMRSTETRAATDIADIRRGWVTRMFAFEPCPLKINESRMYCGTERGLFGQ